MFRLLSYDESWTFTNIREAFLFYNIRLFLLMIYNCNYIWRAKINTVHLLGTKDQFWKPLYS
jgi:hypothetical protein